MKQTFIALVCAVLLIGCGERHPNAWKTVNLPNACVANAQGYEAAYTMQHSQAPWFWSRVLVIKYTEKSGTGPNAHVIAITQYDDGLYAYDQAFGARRISTLVGPGLRSNPTTVAILWGGQRFLDAYYKEDRADEDAAKESAAMEDATK